MIGGLKGNIIGIYGNKIFLDVNGVVWEVWMTLFDLQKISDKRNNIFVHTYLSIKENEIMLFGFLDSITLSTFKLLLTVKSVGVKTSLSILSYLKPEELFDAILTGNSRMIKKVQGIGDKTAERIIFELKSKVIELSPKVIPDYKSTKELLIYQDVVQALETLGFPSSKIKEVMKELIAEAKDLTQEELIKNAIKKLS